MHDTPRHPVPAELECALPLDDPDLRAIVEDWAEAMTRKVARMRVAADASDLPTVASLAHWLKGSGGTAGFDAFTEPARRLERAALAQDVDALDDSLATIERLAMAARAGLAAG